MKKAMWLLLLMLWLTACTSEPPELPIRSLTPDQWKTLSNNQWRLTEVIYKGEQGKFDVIEPVLATFHLDKLALRACNSFSLIFEPVNDTGKEYQFIRGDGTARLCENGGSEQESFISQALMATDNYEIVGDTVVLFGDNAQVTFVIDNEAKKPPD